MGVLIKIVDAVLFLFFLAIAVIAPLIDGQTCLPRHIFPDSLVHLKDWYIRQYADYLIAEKPHFYVGIVWLELLFQWPLSLACLYGIAAGKSWFNTTCLIYGISTFTSMVAILSELTWSGKASDNLLMIYYPFLGLAVLAILRGLLRHSGKSTLGGKRPLLNRKKRA